MGHEAIVTGNHPFWQIDGWTDAKNLEVGDDVAVSIDNSCALPVEKTVEQWQYKAAAYLVAQGAISSKPLGFTTDREDYVEDLQQALQHIDDSVTIEEAPVDVEPHYSYPYKYKIHYTQDGQDDVIISWLKEVGLYGNFSERDKHPPFIWDLTREQIQDYIRIW